ncbi:alanine--tRNA ligase [Campylobacter gracilis]|uniref:Alanine--tRNA ligase n=1 Tax=Campylobacter gracilis RM3268 TaxID=553220 RepID=C8PIY0_9BACT|nr:alanine--tRNA ligase [Campylobacter gracilis]AKT92415.1 alanyl-tRNA synthetase [Campylobacter gracilis]EEV16885.1 alanine--tRNA ligase [Campylobacter gracilis RM3268]UEB45402.1 alanine--tRNA ligase [Campylobacter gracilis]SUW81931.1 alanyl-tRNA synthetase [Campylobacter gracilis]
MDIRSEYLNFFASKGHQIIPSAPLVPDDDSLLFTNAGMVPFKSIFTGAVPRPTPPIRTSCQTCIRAGGKHNDLDNVGYTARHHTFFEMLGNFSFGEYFKEQAIAYAWEFITEILKLPKDKLYVTVHEKDDKAYEFWARHIARERIYRFGDHDNFWAMGDTGPCGPCSEIFYDQGEEHFHSPEDYMGGDGDRFLEIWNLVFMQYERSKDGKLSPLPKPSIDTGMGLERVTAIKEGKFSNYDSSLFMPLIDEVAKLCGRPYVYESGASYRVIADHIRSVVFLLAQGTNFNREGRGYVLRRILRRAVRHGYLLGIKEPFMYRLVDKVCELMGGHYAYLNEKKEAVKEQIKLEEERFFATLANGIELFNEELARTKEIFSGEVAFKLYDTYGFPLDLTADMLREKNLRVDEAKFDALMSEQRQIAKAAWKGSGDKNVRGDFKALLEKFGENKFSGYEELSRTSKVLALLNEDFAEVDELKAGDIGWAMFDVTPFYAQSGGQTGDSGEVESIADVFDTQKFYGLNLSHLRLNRNLKIGDIVGLKVSEEREQIARHHSATHLLHAALRAVLGAHIAQAGSLVEADRLRFDFSHPKALSDEELAKIEEFVNNAVCKGCAAKTEIMDIDDAKNSGAIALFGEKYGSKVRVVSFGEISKELCGGIHVRNLSEIGSFFIVKESGVSAGVRRIEAVCSRAALNLALQNRAKLAEISAELKGIEPLRAIEKLKDEIRSLKDQIKHASSSHALAFLNVGDTKLCVASVESGDIKTMIDEFKNSHEKAAIMLMQVGADGKISIAAGVKNAPIKAGEWVKLVAQILGGGGGGRDDFATAGGKDVLKIEEAIKEAISYAKGKI